MLVFAGEFDCDIYHDDLGFIPSGTISYEYYWTDRWFNVFRFLLPDGGLRNYYCNVNLPPTLENGVLDYVDLDIDVVIWPDGSHNILDMDEFEENATVFGYPSEVRAKALDSLAELIATKDERKFPFYADLHATNMTLYRVS